MKTPTYCTCPQKMALSYEASYGFTAAEETASSKVTPLSKQPTSNDGLTWGKRGPSITPSRLQSSPWVWQENSLKLFNLSFCLLPFHSCLFHRGSSKDHSLINTLPASLCLRDCSPRIQTVTETYKFKMHWETISHLPNWAWSQKRDNVLCQQGGGLKYSHTAGGKSRNSLQNYIPVTSDPENLGIYPIDKLADTWKD